MRCTVCPAVALLVMAACGAGADGRAAGDSGRAGADSAATSDSGRGAFAPRLASDGMLIVVTMSPLTHALRMAADSFSAREAVRVVLDTLPSLAPLTRAPREDADIIAVSTTVLRTRFLATDRASWSFPFARNRVVLAWTDSSRRAADIDSASWRRILARRTTRTGRADPQVSVLGVHTLFAMQLAEQHLADGGLATRLGAAPTYPSTDSLLAALLSNELDVIWTYESAARAAGLRWLNLGNRVDLGDDAEANSYGAASTLIVHVPPRDSAAARDSTAPAPVPDSLRVRGVPLRYALTIPRQSLNLAEAERFVRFLFSPDGQRILRGGAFDVIDPLVVVGTGVPTAVAVMADSVAQRLPDSTRAPARRP
ncbi:MAG: substrate-binding domain-containing protein [Gemmatimonadaceae bacterium]|nr:substrate-binding domain-containing protein [Gemmatimonadaceae bacterium]